MILAGDLGGTKSNLGAFEWRDEKLHCLVRERFSSHEHAQAEDVVRTFAQKLSGKVTAACFDVAGPVLKNTVRATNLPWVVDGAKLARLLGLDRVPLLNDLEATGYGLLALEPSEIQTLQAGEPSGDSNQALIAAGTGLGQAVLFWNGQRRVPVATEGGHADFAPPNDLGIELLRHLKKKHNEVDCEAIISGRGFREIHEFLDPEKRHAAFDNPNVDSAVEITRRALDGSCTVCEKSVEAWVEFYGAEAGNLALRSMARGGVYVAGGIALKILPKMKDGRFTNAFAAKSKFHELLSRIPIYLLRNEDAPLVGSAYFAAQVQQG